MSKPKWTPGPWEYRTDGDRHYVGTGPFCIVDESYATSQTPDRGAKERKANAILIAAAPDLYEALTIAQAILGSVTQDSLYDAGKRKIDAALSKAIRKKRSDSGRMRPTTIDEICDRFAALPADGRDGLLLTLQQIDRVLRKRDARLSDQLADDQAADLVDIQRGAIEIESGMERDRR